MILSILIPTLETRYDTFEKLRIHLSSQCGNRTAHEYEKHEGGLIERSTYEKVEIISYTDNKQKSTGYKRNELLHQAKGDYVVFCDDDDFVTEDYVSQLLKGCESGMDCMAISGWMTTNGANRIEWKISKDYENVTVKESGKPVYLRTTNHITAVKRELALLAGFPDKSNAEDKSYTLALRPYLKTEYKIEKLIYHYRFSTFQKEYV